MTVHISPTSIQNGCWLVLLTGLTDYEVGKMMQKLSRARDEFWSGRADRTLCMRDFHSA